MATTKCVFPYPEGALKKASLATCLESSCWIWKDLFSKQFNVPGAREPAIMWFKGSTGTAELIVKGCTIHSNSGLHSHLAT